MDCALLSSSPEAAPRPALPARIKALCIAGSPGLGAWLSEALAADSAAHVQLVESRSAAEALQQVRDEVFDVLLVENHPELDAFDLLDALRASGCEEPAVVLGQEAVPECLALALEAGADAYIPLRATTTRALIWTLARAVERGELLRENRRLRQADRQRLELEHLETQRLIDEQRALIRELEDLEGSSAADPLVDEAADDEIARERAFPDPLLAHYQQLLRTYVIMGSGNLAGEIRMLARMLADAGVGARRAIQLHLEVVESMVRGLGSRSTRHIMTRADLLALELTVELAEAFRQRWENVLHPAEQRWLPGFFS